ncbi:MAG: hypothetical protein AB8F94_02585 [Saprospiraceae bacterium]
MFSNIKIISRSNNSEELPNKDWTLKTKIVCTCDLELGLGDKITFKSSEAPSLKKVISIYKALQKGNSNSEIFLLNKYELLIDQKSGKTLIEVKRENWDNSKSVLLQKENYYYSPYLEKFRVNILNQLLYNTNEEIRKYYCQQLLGDYNKSDDFAIGTKVETIISDNVKTIRNGYIIAQGYSKDWDTYCYSIFTDGQFYNKRYRKEDLIKKENGS